MSRHILSLSMLINKVNRTKYSSTDTKTHTINITSISDIENKSDIVYLINNTTSPTIYIPLLFISVEIFKGSPSEYKFYRFKVYGLDESYYASEYELKSWLSANLFFRKLNNIEDYLKLRIMMSLDEQFEKCIKIEELPFAISDDIKIREASDSEIKYKDAQLYLNIFPERILSNYNVSGKLMQTKRYIPLKYVDCVGEDNERMYIYDVYETDFNSTPVMQLAISRSELKQYMSAKQFKCKINTQVSIFDNKPEPHVDISSSSSGDKPKPPVDISSSSSGDKPKLPVDISSSSSSNKPKPPVDIFREGNTKYDIEQKLKSYRHAKLRIALQIPEINEITDIPEINKMMDSDTKKYILSDDDKKKLVHVSPTEFERNDIVFYYNYKNMYLPMKFVKRFNHYYMYSTTNFEKYIEVPLPNIIEIREKLYKMNTLSGGQSALNYFKLYNKYKTKYLNLKNQKILTRLV